MTKMTYVDALNIAIKACADNKEVVDKLTALRVQTEKKNASKSSKPNKAQVANAEKRNEILHLFESLTAPITVAEFAEKFEMDKAKLTGNFTQLVKAGKLIATKETADGKKSKVNLYILAPSEDGDEEEVED